MKHGRVLSELTEPVPTSTGNPGAEYVLTRELINTTNQLDSI